MGPLNWVGAALILIGLVLFFSDFDIDLDVPGLDVPGIGGGICVVLGTFLLFDDLRVGAGVLVVTSLFVTARIVVRHRMIDRQGGYPTEMQTLVGQTGYTTTALEPRGTVQVASEMWSAVSDSGQSIEEGAEVMVVDVDGLTLKVFKTTETSN